MMNRKFFNWGKKWALVLAVALLMTGCKQGVQIQNTVAPTTVPVMPDQQNEDVYQYDLYFGYQDATALVAQQGQVVVSESKQVEVALLEGLIAGPASGSGLERLIDAQTTVQSVTSSRDYLYVVFSREFLNPIGVSDGWENDADMVELVQRQRQMAVWSVVNTLTELGRYSRIQIMIDVDGSGEGQRPTRYMLGFSENAEDTTLMESLARNDAVIYDAKMALVSAMEALGKQDYKHLMTLIATQEDQNRPDDTSLMTSLSGAGLVLITYSLVSSQTSVDGQSALIMVDYEVQLQDGSHQQRTDAPIRMVRENNVWKISYQSINQLLEGNSQ